MMTRSKSGIFKPKIYNAVLDTEEPITHYQAMQNKNWRTAIAEEYEALMRNKTWNLVHMPKNKYYWPQMDLYIEMKCKWFNF